MRLSEINGDEQEKVQKFINDIGIADSVKVNRDGTVAIVNRTYLNNIADLEELPFEITTCDADLMVHNNSKLKSFKGCPLHVKGDFDADHCPLITSFEHAPRKIDGDASFYKCKITSMKYTPKFVGGELDASRNEITSIDDLVELTVLSHIDLRNNKIKSFKGVGTKIKQCNGEIDIGGNPVESHVLGFILIEGIESVKFNPEDPEPMKKALTIVNKYIGEGKSGVLKAQDELSDLDLDDFAQL